ncbi:MAG: DUF3795 domain-containing protein [Clostridia bacterium]|nr:DUF3795 domain-containing protein [Clostridia bacterium]
MKKMTAYCGLDCEKCEAYKATLNNDQAMREKVAREWSELNGVDITPDMINCEGCRADGAKTPFCEALCPIRQCALRKGYGTCGDCRDIRSCDKITMITDSNPEALSRLLGEKI